VGSYYDTQAWMMQSREAMLAVIRFHDAERRKDPAEPDSRPRPFVPSPGGRPD
jgi:hypothetical protein